MAGNLVKYNVKKTRERRKLNEKPSKSRVFHDKYKQKDVIAKEKFSPVHEEKKSKQY